MTKYIATAATAALFLKAPTIGLSTADRQSFDAIARQFLAGPPEADPDRWFAYYSGPRLLAEMRLGVPLIDLLAATFMQAQGRGLVSLRQRRTRLADHTPTWTYEARLSPAGRVPQEAMGSRVGSSPSPAFNGVAPAVGKKGEFLPPSRVERQDGIGRPSLENLEGVNGHD